jgi:hypothetical protein
MENNTEGKKTILIPSLSEEDAGVAVATIENLLGQLERTGNRVGFMRACRIEAESGEDYELYIALIRER